MSRIAAGFVLFNPDNLERMYASIASVLEQVETVYVFDNSTHKESFDFLDSVIYITENDNKGLAYALNRIMEHAARDGFDWVVTIDQDSIMPDGAVTLYKQHINDDPKLAIICPQVIDSRRSYMEIKKEPSEEFIGFCITSASCTNLHAHKAVGGFDEWLFIDLVDNDFCKRLVASGYKIERLNKLVLDQEFGTIAPKSKKIQKFWNKVAKIFRNDNFGKLGYSKSVNPTRVYFTCRNIIYINKKLKKYGKIGYRENYNCNGFLGFTICFILPSILRAKEKGKVIEAVKSGLRDGEKSQPIIWSAKEWKDEGI